MVVVHIPTYWRDQLGGRERVEVTASTIRELIDALEVACPGIKALLTKEDGQVRSEIAVAVDSTLTRGRLVEPVPPDAEIRFLPALSGG